MKLNIIDTIKNVGITMLLLVLFLHCESSARNETAGNKVARDTTIGTQNAYSHLDFDSTALEQYILKRRLSEAMSANLRNFYNRRNFYYAWFNEDGLTEQANAFWNLHNSYVKITGDSSLYEKKLHTTVEALLQEPDISMLTDSALTEVELDITIHFFQYAKAAYQGKIDPSDLQWHIPRRKINVVALLDSLVNSTGKAGIWEPVNADYVRLKRALKKYYGIQQRGAWITIIPETQVLRVGDTSLAVVQLKQRLMVTGDLATADTSAVFTLELQQAVKQVQQRFGLLQDGIAGPATLKALNVPVEARIKQMLVNLERMKWMPVSDEKTKLVANIPAYKLYVYENGQVLFNMNIVVGKAGTNTVIFSDQLEYVVFSPYWNVPRSIVRNEILPAMRNNPGYLQNNNMEQTGTANGLPVIRQKPGGSNALGRVKFIFPNNYNIYFHDTPSRHLFSRNERAFSHGCIRLAQPVRLAEYLLRSHAEWDAAAIDHAMYAEKEKWVKLEKTIPVYITYFTSWADENGIIHFREDVYGHDKKLMKQLLQ